jgi:Cu(I)/Ag(I) efflux system membrane fusion protein
MESSRWGFIAISWASEIRNWKSEIGKHFTFNFQLSKFHSPFRNFKFQISIFIILYSLVSCKTKTSDQHAATLMPQYTCPMHPQILRDAPGKCPICGMELVKITKADAANNDLMLSNSQMQLANITTQKVSQQPLGQTAVVNGRLVTNEDLTEVISTRASGRIEKLFVKETGRAIQKGTPLYEVYSETLQTLQKEYLLAKEQFETLGKTEKRFESFFKGAEKKLLLYGLTEQQIQKLGQSKTIQSRITFLSPASGVVTEISATEGQYINEGGSLFKIDDISKLWIEAELYPSETSLAKTGDKVNVRINGFENNPTEAPIIFLSPEFRTNTQITVMRASIDNVNMDYKPGMQVQVLFTHSSRKVLAVPINAVIRDGQGTHVYLQRGTNTFRPQMVKTGLEDFDKVEITEGLNEGDTVAVTGAYLLYSEIILKKGTDPMAGHNRWKHETGK